ncbi:MAG: hypothetical protein JST04_04200 [Bdellovibrionales bacterium]|nr:hypothetical protein [Bdellovibrionales bacterium]
MKRGGRKLLLAIALLFAALAAGLPSAHAAGRKEFFLNSGGLELLGGASRISLAPGLNWGFYEWLQAGASLSYQKIGYGDDSVNTLTFSFGPTFNLGGPYEQATFIFFGGAYRKGSGEVSDPENDPGGLGLAFLVGRRIPLFGNVGYRPTVGLQLAGKTTIVINALAISYFF